MRKRAKNKMRTVRSADSRKKISEETSEAKPPETKSDKTEGEK